MEQFSGQFSETSTGLNKFGQHSNLAQTRRQKSATWSDVRTILATALYVLPLYLEGRKTDGKTCFVSCIPKIALLFSNNKAGCNGFSTSFVFIVPYALRKVFLRNVQYHAQYT